MNAIFNNVDHNGHDSNALFKSSNNHKPKYTATMKSANSAIRSVVTVENDTSNNSSSVQTFEMHPLKHHNDYLYRYLLAHVYLNQK